MILHGAGSPINLLLLPHKSLPDLLMTLMAQPWQPAPSQGKCPLHTFPIKLLSLPLQLHPPCPLAPRAQAVLGKDTCPRVHPTPPPPRGLDLDQEQAVTWARRWPTPPTSHTGLRAGLYSDFISLFLILFLLNKRGRRGDLWSPNCGETPALTSPLKVHGVVG